jgi:proline dehydrogenase
VIANLPARALRTLFLSLSRRRGIGEAARRSPLTRSLVRRFVAGETLDEAIAALAELRDAGLLTTVDVLGEGVMTEGDARAASAEYVTTLQTLAREDLDRNVSLKLTQLGLALDPALCAAAVGQVVETAEGLGGFVRVDMEDHPWTDATIDLVRELRRRHSNVGIVLQAYLRRTARDLEMLVSERVPIRLCKGAYDEPPEVAYATKVEVDHRYERLMERLLLSDSPAALATHDPVLIAKARAFADANGIARDGFEFQMLYGIRRDLQRELVTAGYKVRVYVPYGRQWYPYFMRRLAERPANLTFVLRNLLRDRDSS